MATPPPVLNNVKLLQETSVVHPHRTVGYHGETINFTIDFRNYGAALDLAGATATLYWRVPGDAEGYWHQAEATCAGSTASWTWDASMDNGESPVIWFLKVDADDSNDTTSYRATGELRLLASPGFTPAVVPPARMTLDFDLINVLHAPYYTKEEADGRFASDEDIPSPSTSNPQMDGAASAGVSDAYARGDHRHPTDTSRFGGPSSVDEFRAYSENGTQGLYKNGAVYALPPGEGAPAGGTIALTKNIPAVVAPSTSSSDAGKAADAKATGDALAGKVSGTDDGTYIALPNGRSLAVQGDINCTGGIVVPNGAVTASAIIINNVQYSAETWEFTLDDDSTVQKQLLVAPVAAQGGA